MKYIFDFDDVLFNNTKQFKEHMYAIMATAGVPKDKTKGYYEPMRQREFSLKKFIAQVFYKEKINKDPEEVYERIMEKCPNFVNKELLESIRRVGVENCYIVTNGEREFQEEKLKRSGVWDLFNQSHIYIVPESKKEAVKEICGKYPQEDLVFLDDKKSFLKDIKSSPDEFPNLTLLEYNETNRNVELAEIRGKIKLR